MNDLNKLEKSVPDKNFTFNIEIEEGELTRESIKGEFTYTIPNLKAQAQISKHKALLNGGLEDLLDVGTKDLHYMISYLRYTLVAVPEWWKAAEYGYTLWDINIVEKVYEKATEFENEYMSSIWGTTEKKEEKDSE